MAFEKFSQEPFNLVTDSAYVADIAQRLGYSVLKETDVTQVAEFGRIKYVHVTVHTFSSAMWVSAHTGEKTRDVIAHWRQAFAIEGIPSAVKTNNGPAYASQKASDETHQPQAKVRNLVTKQWEGPYDLIAMGRGQIALRYTGASVYSRASMQESEALGFSVKWKLFVEAAFRSAPPSSQSSRAVSPIPKWGGELGDGEVILSDPEVLSEAGLQLPREEISTPPSLVASPGGLSPPGSGVGLRGAGRAPGPSELLGQQGGGARASPGPVPSVPAPGTVEPLLHAFPALEGDGDPGARPPALFDQDSVTVWCPCCGTPIACPVKPAGAAQPALASGLAPGGAALATSPPAPPAEGARGVDAPGGGAPVGFSLDPAPAGGRTAPLRSGTAVPAVGVRPAAGTLLGAVPGPPLPTPAVATAGSAGLPAAGGTAPAAAELLLPSPPESIPGGQALPGCVRAADPFERSPAAGAAALQAGSSPAGAGAAPASAAEPAPPPFPAASAAPAADAGVFKFSASGDTAGMRPVFDRSKGPRTVGSSSTAWWTLPPSGGSTPERPRAVLGGSES
ncbi:skin secretory protein xP2-like [Prinia subflava]|uniref:skin secretory protein xP2-like n=1 Tax=Prinia subflava TaxID=208062 RepID=UPI002FDFDF64